MNIFKMSDDEFENYLRENIDVLDPDELMDAFIEAGLESERDDDVLVKVPENFLIKNIITDAEHLYKTGELDIDDCLVDEIKDLWYMGIHTRGCCCGHGELEGYIEVERTDIPKMLDLGYTFYNGKNENNYDTFIPKSKCCCSTNEVMWEWPRLD